MTTVDIPVGTPVFVRWYGKIVQGETIDREGHCNPPFTDFIPVSMEIPSQDGTPIVPGIRNICMFQMRHVYASAEEAAALPSPCAPSAAPPACAHMVSSGSPAGSPIVPPTSSDHSRPLPTPSTKSCPSEAWLAVQKFKKEHWDHDHNRLHLDYWPEFDRLWRVAVAAKYGITIDPSVPSGSPAGSPIVAVDPGSPDGDRSATYIVDTETGEILSESLSPHAEAQPQPITNQPPKHARLTRKQLRSTGRIEFTDSIQTSLFD